MLSGRSLATPESLKRVAYRTPSNPHVPENSNAPRLPGDALRPPTGRVNRRSQKLGKWHSVLIAWLCGNCTGPSHLDARHGSASGSWAELRSTSLQGETKGPALNWKPRRSEATRFAVQTITSRGTRASAQPPRSGVIMCGSLLFYIPDARPSSVRRRRVPRCRRPPLSHLPKTLCPRKRVTFSRRRPRRCASTTPGGRLPFCAD